MRVREDGLIIRGYDGTAEHKKVSEELAGKEVMLKMLESSVISIAGTIYPEFKLDEAYYSVSDLNGGNKVAPDPVPPPGFNALRQIYKMINNSHGS